MSLQLAGVIYLQHYSSVFARWDIAHEKGPCRKYLETSLSFRAELGSAVLAVELVPMISYLVISCLNEV